MDVSKFCYPAVVDACSQIKIWSLTLAVNIHLQEAQLHHEVVKGKNRKKRRFRLGRVNALLHGLNANLVATWIG